MDLNILIYAALISSLIGAAIGASKGRGGAGFFFGGLLGPIGWLLVAVGPNYRDSSELAPEPKPSAENQSPADRIMDLKRLLDAGAISQSEFDIKKTGILETL